MLGATHEGVLVLGGGLVGPLAAMFLSRAGHQVQVVERRPDPRSTRLDEGRSINLTLGERAWKALGAVGLEADTRAISVPLYGRMLHHETGQLVFQPYGPRREALHSVERDRLHRLLVQALERDPRIRIAFEHRCRGVDLDGPYAEIEDMQAGKRSRLGPQPIIAADGAFSAAHGKNGEHVQVQRSTLEIGYKELRIPPRSDGHWALEPNALHIWPRETHFIAAFPNLDRSFTCSLFLPNEGEPSFASLASEADVRHFFESVASDLPPLMPSLYEDFFEHPTASLITVRCSRWSLGDRVLLIGDAAHAVVPFLGQGLNAGFEDCLLLSELLDETPGCWSDVFARFQQLRKPDCDCLAQLAIRHFKEISEHVRDPEFQRRKRVEARLFDLYPDRFIPFYAAVSFTRLPYRAIHERAHLLDSVVDRVLAIENVDQRWNDPELSVRLEAVLAHHGL